MSGYSREDKLYILAHNCQINKLTPDSPAYKGFIKRVCVSRLSMSLNAVDEYTECLTSAYRTDKWQGILEEETLADTKPEDGDDLHGFNETGENTSWKSEAQPRVNDFKTLTFKSPCEPIKTLPTKTVHHPEYSPKTTAEILLRLAHNDEFNGAGRLMLAEIRQELQDPTLQLQDVIKLLNQYCPSMTIEPRPKQTIIIYFNGKNSTQYHRSMRMVEPETLALSFTEEE